MIGGEPAGLAIDQCRTLGFEGELWPVHPTRSHMRGLGGFPSVADLPAPPDAAFIAVNRHAAIDTVRALARRGCGAAVLYSSGFAEAGDEGAALQAELVEAAGAMPVIGPNCYGTLSAVSGAALWPDLQGLKRVERGMAVITQSGNIALNLTMQDRALDIAHVLTLGNQCDVSIEDCLDVLVDDPRVTSVAMHIEALSDIEAFADAVRRGRHRGMPLVALRTGASTQSASIALSHTSSIVGNDRAYDALFERLGVRRVFSIPELLDTAHLLDTIGPLNGGRLVSLSCSGGEASLVADRALGHDVEFAAFTPEHSQRIQSTLNDLVAITNPLDYHTFIWGKQDELTACFTEALTGPVDAGMLVLDFPRADLGDASWWPTLRAFGAASAASGTPAVVTSSLAENFSAAARSAAVELGLAALTGIDSTLRCLDAAAWLGSHSESAPLLHPTSAAGAEVRTLTEHESKDLLAEAGIDIPRWSLTNATDAAAAATAIGFPVVMKATGLAHKSDSGGVILDVGDADRASSAAAELSQLGPELLVEQQAPSGIELLITVSREDPIGYLLTVGAGGTLVEVLRDTQSRLLPLHRDQVSAALDLLGIGALLRGHRGAPPAAVEAVVDVVDALTSMVACDPGIVEIEINPLIVGRAGAVVVDALIRRSDDG